MNNIFRIEVTYPFQVRSEAVSLLTIGCTKFFWLSYLLASFFLSLPVYLLAIVTYLYEILNIGIDLLPITIPDGKQVLARLPKNT